MLIERIGLILDSCYNLTEGELPALKVPSFRPRNNQEGDCFISSLKEEARGDGLPFFLNKDFETVLTYPASPHTPLKDEKGRPYHLILWFWVFNEDKNN